MFSNVCLTLVSNIGRLHNKRYVKKNSKRRIGKRFFINAKAVLVCVLIFQRGGKYELLNQENDEIIHHYLHHS